jgi:hypothetical protein
LRPPGRDGCLSSLRDRFDEYSSSYSERILHGVCLLADDMGVSGVLWARVTYEDLSVLAGETSGNGKKAVSHMTIEEYVVSRRLGGDSH